MDSRIEKISLEIGKIKTAVEVLDGVSQGLPALDRNLRRISASLKMLELNFVDPGEYGKR